MRCLLCTLGLLGTLALVLLTGCRSQTTGMTNPFLAPNRVPPPATRTLLPGTAQPYYPGDPVPNSSAIGAPPAGYAPSYQQPSYQQPSYQQAPPTYAPQPAGTVPPGGWDGAPQPFPGGSSSYNVSPSSIQPASAVAPLTGQQIQVQPDKQNLRFAQTVPLYQQPVVPTTSVATLPPDRSVLPTPRQVRIRAISSDNLDLDTLNSSSGPSASRDGFRPQGSSQVRKPTIASRLVPRKRQPASERFGFDPQYSWLRGQLQYSSATGQWGLHYLSTEGRADQFGGNLTIANPQVLGDLQPGDFVQLRGRVEGSPNGAAYKVSVVQRQRI